MDSQDKNLDIQVLRAIAIIMVIIQHYRNRLPSPEFYLNTFKYVNYWASVDIFFAISGYLMCKSILKEIDKTGRSFTTFFNFVNKRMFRLLPCLILWGVACIIIAYIIQPAWGVSPGKSLTTLYTSLLGYSNIHFYSCLIQSIDCDQMNAVTWSLSLEWQLYLIISLIMILTNRKFYIYWFFLIVIAALFLPVSDALNRTIGWWIRPQAFFLGAIIFLLQDKLIIKLIWLRRIMAVFAMLILLIAPNNFNYHVILPIIGLAGAGLLLTFLGGNIISRSNSFIYKTLDWVGDRSYSLYLCHIPLMHLTREMLNRFLNETIFYENIIFYFCTYFLLLTLLSNASYKYVELTLINIGKRLRNRNCAFYKSF